MRHKSEIVVVVILFIDLFLLIVYCLLNRIAEMNRQTVYCKQALIDVTF